MNDPQTTWARNLQGFTGAGYDRGRNRAWQLAWMITSSLIFTRWWCPADARTWILQRFGATIGSGALVRHGVRIHWPWKLRVGDNTWIGEGVWILNLEPVTIGSNVCISQEALLCTGSHDRRSPTFEFDNAPIEICDGVWVGVRATVLRGVRIAERTVVGAGSLITSDVPADSLVLASRASITKQVRKGKIRERPDLSHSG